MRYLKDSVVLITGAGGSIGSELSRQVLKHEPRKLILLGRGENSIYAIHQELAKKSKHTLLVQCICDLRDIDGLRDMFGSHFPEYVFHAAAHKHVPLMELNPKEAFKNNCMGSYNLMLLSVQYLVKKFVLMSTDKAVNPTSVMGATKRIVEKMMLSMSKSGDNKTCFSAVRFGNVLGSRGSVVPLFERQIAEGGPVTVTHKDVIRYFMTIPQASGLALEAGEFAKGGEIFVLDMGRPVRIYELAVNMIRKAGKTPKQIKIKFTGLREGEKIYEEVVHSEEDMRTENKRIFITNLGHDGDVMGRFSEVENMMTDMNDINMKKYIFELAR